MENDKYQVVVRLHQAMLQLEDAIAAAREGFLKRENPPQEALRRLAHYDEIVAKQRAMMPEIIDYIDQENTVALAQLVTRHRALSAMIHSDAAELLRQLSSPSQKSTSDADC